MSRSRRYFSPAFLGRCVLTAVAVFWICAMVVYAISESRLQHDYRISVAMPAPDPRLASEGEHLVRSRGCTDCHGADLKGKVVLDEMPVARVVGTNLVSAEGRDTMHERIYRALHHGVDMASRPLMVMPSASYASLSRTEIEAIAAYLSSLPPETKALPRSSLGPLGRVLLAVGQLDGFLPAEDIDHTIAPVKAPPPLGTIAYGQHMAQLCKGCHQPDFRGGPIAHGPHLPPASNLTPHATGLLRWTEDDFVSAMRTGRRPDGTRIDENAMPWRAIGHASSTELRSIWRYLRTVPAIDHDVRAPR